MKRTLVIGLALAALLTSCEKATEPKPAQKASPVRAIAAVDVTSPAREPVHIVQAEKEKPEPPRQMSGPARPADKEDQTPVPTPEVQPKSDYPRAKPAHQRAQVAAVPATHRSYPVASLPNPAHRSNPVVSRPNPVHTNYPVASTRNPTAHRIYPAASRPSPTAHSPTARSLSAGVGTPRPHPNSQISPQNFNQPRTVPRPPTYPQAGTAPHQQMAWESERRRLQNDFMQARADALNIKYNRGRPHFTAHSHAVMVSASAPPTPRTRPTAPWDRLGQAFDRSEQARQRLRAHEQSRYRPQQAYRPPMPQAYRPPTPRAYSPPMPPAYCPPAYSPPIPGRFP